MNHKVLEPPLDQLSAVARPYPAHLLDDCQTGLVLFAAAFRGHNDAIHFARRQLHTTCVDRDAHRLAEMSEVYPPDWEFAAEDAWEYATHAYLTGRTWDAVSVDTFTGDATDLSIRTLDLWCSVANRLVTATIRNDDADKAWTPDGWRMTPLFPRSATVSWLVLRRD